MASSSTDALLTEHLTYPPVALVDDIVNNINTLVFRATSAVEKGLLAAPPSSLGLRLPPTTDQLPDEIKHEIENGVHQLETLIESKIDKNFDKLEIYIMRNILVVPEDVKDYVKLSHYDNLDFSNVAAEEGAGDEGPTAESVKQQRLKLREMMKLQTLLLQEQRKNESTLASIRALLGHTDTKAKIEPGTDEGVDGSAFGFLQNKGALKGDATRQVATSTEFALSNLPALKEILHELAPRLEVLQTAAGGDHGDGDAKSEWRRERTAFVEKETRRHLEGVRGLELGEQGGVRDGEWQGEGRKVSREEVEGLERVVGLFAPAESGKTKEGDAMDES